MAKHFLHRAFLYCLVGIGGWLCVPSASSASDIYQQRQDVVFHQSHGIAVTMDIFVPKQNANGLAIVDIASGGWSSSRSKIRDHKLAQVYNVFCGRGYTVFAVRPGSASRFSAQDMAEHIEAAIVWVKQNAATYKVDPAKIGLTGASAGGHLAAMVAARHRPADAPSNTQPDAGVSAVGIFFPPTDFLQWGDGPLDPNGSNEVAVVLRALAFRQGTHGLSPDDIQQRMAEISPARMVHAKMPPFMLIHGDADPVVPLQQSERMVQQLRAKQVSAELIVKPGGGHPWMTIPVEVAKLADWFDRQLRPGTPANAAGDAGAQPAASSEN